MKPDCTTSLPTPHECAPGPLAAITTRFAVFDRVRRALPGAIVCLLAFPAAALSQTLLDATYDSSNDALVVHIAYQGTHPNHRFTLEWEPCQKAADGRGTTAVARLIDQSGDDLARDDFQVRRRFELSGLDCRPADVTIRLGPVSNRTVSVPARSR